MKSRVTFFLRIGIYFITLALSRGMLAQSIYPEIVNYDFGGGQNWGVDIDKNKIIYIANNSGLSQFDGQSWKLHKVPKNMILRSVLCVGDLIFTGSYEEFGYWKKNKAGDLFYHSLRHKFPRNYPDPSEEFWQIIEHNGIIYFRSFGSIYSYKNDHITLVANSLDISSMAIYNNRLIYGSLSQGLYEIDGSRIDSFTDFPLLTQFKSVNNVASYEDLFFVYDINNGGVLLKNKKVIDLSDPLNKLLRDDLINKVEFLNSEVIVFGTIKNGILLYNIYNQKFQSINRKAGINNNTILDLKYHEGNIWLALDNGISRIAVDSDFSFYYDDTGVLGTVYDIEFFKNQYYLASNTGVYTFVNDELTLIDNSKGHCWEICRYNDQLLFGHNNGAFVLDSTRLKPIKGSYSGVYDFEAIPGTKTHLLSTYSGLGLVNYEDEEWGITKLEGLKLPIDNIVMENDSIIWAMDNFKNLYKIQYNQSKQIITGLQEMQKEISLLGDDLILVSISHKPYFIINGKWHRYSHKANQFETLKTFQDNLLIGQSNKDLWFIDNSNNRIVQRNNDSNETYFYSNQSLMTKLVENQTKVIHTSNNKIVMNLKDGFAIINTSKPLERISIKRFNIESVVTDGMTRKFNNSNELQLSFKEAKSITFSFYIPGIYHSNLKYILSGARSQSDKINNGTVTLRNLPTGSYELHLIDMSNQTIDKRVYIEVLPPWYYSWWMKLIYFMSLLGLIITSIRIQERKAEKKLLKIKRVLAERSKRQLEKIEKENLIKEIASGQKELINRTATIVRKNEAIISLRNEIRKLQEDSPNKVRTSNILKRTAEFLDSKNDWLIFETKFNALNEDFFKNLSSRYPKLTSKDQKLCAYIKIGLTSKEIAPLLGITSRSVELQRYRLRKKLNMPTDLDFNDFLKLL